MLEEPGHVRNTDENASQHARFATLTTTIYANRVMDASYLGALNTAQKKGDTSLFLCNSR